MGGDLPLECLEGGGHELLDEPFLVDRAGTAAELNDGQDIEMTARRTKVGPWRPWFPDRCE
jgi:hypothetical protein